jgi:hypothetical protein
MAKNNKSNRTGIFSLVLAIVGALLFLLHYYIANKYDIGLFSSLIVVVGLITSVIGIILAVEQKNIKPNALATTSLVLNIIEVIIFGLFSFFLLLLGIFNLAFH